MARSSFFALCSLLLFLNADCRNDGITPEEILPGTRNYTWKVDTLYAKPGDIIYAIWNIWGSSPDDVWMIANADPEYRLWHYNGQQWLRDTSNVRRNPMALFGTAKNDIWMAGVDAGASFWRFDGISWKFFSETPIPGYDLTNITNIRGKHSTELYATGFSHTMDGSKDGIGIVLRFDGTKWATETFLNVHYGIFEVCSQGNELVFYLSKHDNSTGLDSNMIIHYQNGIMTELYHGIDNVYPYELNNKVYVTLQKKIYVIESSKLRLWKDFSGTDFLGTVSGRSEKDFFCVGKKGLMHYNGTDLELLFPSSPYITNITVFESEIYFGVYDNTTNRNFIVKGVISH